MTNQEAMEMLTEMGLHEGGMENWVVGNAWFRFANVVQAAEREACARVAFNAKTYIEAAEAIRQRGKTE